MNSIPVEAVACTDTETVAPLIKVYVIRNISNLGTGKMAPTREQAQAHDGFEDDGSDLGWQRSGGDEVG
jgi:hypothetical protein